MFRQKPIPRAVALALLGGALGSALPALAQDEATDIGTVVVTGSRISRTNLESTTPVLSIGRAEFDAQFRFRRYDGAYRYMRSIARPRYSENGEYLGYVGSTIDVTSVREAQDKLREGMARLTAVVGTAADAIITIDDRGLIDSVNPATERMFGYAGTELVGRNVALLMPEPYASAHDGYLENYRSTGVRQVIGVGREVVGRRKDGSSFPIDLSVSEVMLGGGGRLFTGIVRDATARRAAERDLRASHALLRAVVEGITDPVYVKDVEGRYLLANSAMAASVGRPSSDVVGSTDGDLFG